MNIIASIVLSLHIALASIFAPVCSISTLGAISTAYLPGSTFFYGNDFGSNVNLVENVIDILSDFASLGSVSSSGDTTYDFSINPTLTTSPSTNYYTTNTTSSTTTHNYNDYDYSVTTRNYYTGDTNNYCYYTTDNSWNPIYNEYNESNTTYYTCDQSINDSYNTYFYSDDDYYYMTVNYVTYQQTVAQSKSNPYTLTCYNSYFETPSGENSYNLTPADVYGTYFVDEIYNYGQTVDSPNLLGLWHFDGNSENEIADSDVEFVYSSTSYLTGKFGSSLQTNGNTNAFITGLDDYDQYTVEYWHYNAGNNGTLGNIDYGSANSWVYVVLTYDNGTVRQWVNGSEVEKATNATRYSRVSLGSNSATQTTPTVYAYAPYSGVSSYGTNSNPNGSKFIYVETTDHAYYPTSYYTSTTPVTIYPTFAGSWSVSGSMYRTWTYNNSTYRSTTTVTNNTVSKNTSSYYGSGVSTSSDSNGKCNSLHYYPLATSSGVEFGYWGGTDSHTADMTLPTSKGYYCNLSSCIYWNGSITETASYGTASLWDSHFGQNVTFTAGVLSNFIAQPANDSTMSVSDVDLGSDWLDSSNCAIDELRVSSGLIYNGNTPTTPSQPFTAGYIWTAPTGSNYNLGDIAIQDTSTIADWRIGGANYSYPQIGYLYVQLVDSYGYKAYVYKSSGWVEVNCAVWNGSQWVTFTNFNFSTLQFGSAVSASTSTTIINNYSSTYQEYFGDGEAECDSIADFVKLLPVVFAFIGAVIGACLPFVPAWVIALIGFFTGFIIVLITYKLIRG